MEVILDAVVTDPAGRSLRVPCFWAGRNEWRVRFAPRATGPHRFRTECSDATDAGLHAQEGSFEGAPPDGRGPLRISSNRRYLEHEDGTPFFWLGDTWWTALSTRLRWPEEFKLLAADRKAKGFSVLQVVVGVPPDDSVDGAKNPNEAGLPWTKDWSSINPAYFEMADRRLLWLAGEGFRLLLVPCWGYVLPAAGVEQAKRYWRYLIARYGSLPVAWCLAGEFSAPHYVSTNREEDRKTQIDGWAEVALEVRKADPWGHLITVHPEAPHHSRETRQIADRIDFNLVQIGHAGYRSKQFVRPLLASARAARPTMPVINDEACYEGIAEICPDRLVRHMFWNSFLLGCCGFTYGANGIWQLNRADAPYGLSPHGISWGDQPWEEAMRFPGSRQVGIGRRLLDQYPWWRFEPRQDWLRHAPREYDERQLDPPCCAGIPREVRMIYFSDPVQASPSFSESLVGIEPDARYRAFFFNPKTGREHDLGPVHPDSSGTWAIPTPPILMDWILVLENMAIHGKAGSPFPSPTQSRASP